MASESGIAAGVRRLEALTGLGALEHMRRQERLLHELAGVLKSPVQDLPERVERLVAERRELERELEKVRAERRGEASRDLTTDARDVAGTRLVTARVEGVGAKELRSLVDDLKARIGSGVVLLAAEQEGGVALALGVTKDLCGRFRAGDLVREVAAVVGGRGGGRPDFAQAGGNDPSRLDEAFQRLEALLGGEAS